MLEEDGRGRYKKFGKLETPMSQEEFDLGMKTGRFSKRKHKGFVALIYYTGIRSTEARRAVRNQFKIFDDFIMFDVGTRLKHGIRTPSLIIPKSLPYVDELLYSLEDTSPEEKVWNFSKATAYNVVVRAFPFYPHYLRLSRITNFLLEGYDLAKLHSWTGLTLKALNAYVGIVDINKMSKTLS